MGGCNCCLYFMGNVSCVVQTHGRLFLYHFLSLLKSKCGSTIACLQKMCTLYSPCLLIFSLFFSLMIQSGICTFLSLWIFLIKIVCVGRSDYAGRKFLSSASPPTPETRDDLFNWGNRGLRTVFPYQGVGHPLADGRTIHRLASLLTAVIRYWCGTCRGPVFFPLFYFWFFHTDRYASVLLLTIAIFPVSVYRPECVCVCVISFAASYGCWQRGRLYIFSVSACGISCQIHHERQEEGIYKIVEWKKKNVYWVFFFSFPVCVCVWVGLPYHSITDWRRR